MAMVLITLLLAYAGQRSRLLLLAIVLLLLTMARPQLFRPLSVVWFGVSRALGSVISRLILIVTFFGLITPVGLLRRWTGKDALQLRRWKRADGSVLTERQGTIGPDDMAKPY